MKKLFLLAVLLVFTTNTFADKKCKFDHDKVDKTTGKQRRYFSYNIWTGIVRFQLGMNGSQQYFGLEITIGESKKPGFRAGTDTLFIKLENKKVIKLVPVEDTEGEELFDMNARGLQYHTTYRATYHLNNELLDALAESPIVQFDFRISGRINSLTIHDKKAKKMQSGFDCLRQNK